VALHPLNGTGQEALKARSISAWGNAPGFRAHKKLKG